MRYLLDSNVIGDAIRGRGGVNRRLATTAPSDVCTSALVYAEIAYGLRLHPNDRLRRSVESLLRPIAVLDWDRAAAETFAEVVAALPRGQTLPPMDLLIGVHAKSRGLVLVTRNERHFKPIKGLRVESWA